MSDVGPIIDVATAPPYKVGGWVLWSDGHGFSRREMRGKVVKISTAGTISAQYQGGERTFRRRPAGGYTDNLRPASEFELATWTWLALWRRFKRIGLRELEGGDYTVTIHDQRCATIEQIAELVSELNAAARLLDARPTRG